MAKTKRRLQRLMLPRNDPRGYVDKFGVTLYIPVLPMSGNQFIRVHHMKRHRIDNDLGWFFKAAETRIKGLKRSDCYSQVLAVRVGTRKLLDKDNLYSGLKPYLDWLKKLGWIKDDSPEWLDYAVEQARPGCNLRPGVYMRIEYPWVKADGTKAR